ncbi:hypothetical protein IJR75_02490 [bacterium]|nr:hypothetical protein [bacterium]
MNQINDLDTQTKDSAKKLLDSQKKINGEINENKTELIAFYLSQLGEENYENWSNFVEKFNDQN